MRFKINWLFNENQKTCTQMAHWRFYKLNKVYVNSKKNNFNQQTNIKALKMCEFATTKRFQLFQEVWNFQTGVQIPNLYATQLYLTCDF